MRVRGEKPLRGTCQHWGLALGPAASENKMALRMGPCEAGLMLASSETPEKARM